METTPWPSRAVRAGQEIFDLEIAVGSGPASACAAAVAAGARVHESAVLHRISSAADVVAACMLAKPGGRYCSQAAAIMWFAERVLALPALDDGDLYQPVPGDLVEVTLTGAVRAAGAVGWTLAERGTVRQYQFAAPGMKGAPRVQVLDLGRRSQPPGDIASW
jgi:hypothetical protein